MWRTSTLAITGGTIGATSPDSRRPQRLSRGPHRLGLEIVWQERIVFAGISCTDKLTFVEKLRRYNITSSINKMTIEKTQDEVRPSHQ